MSLTAARESRHAKHQCQSCRQRRARFWSTAGTAMKKKASHAQLSAAVEVAARDDGTRNAGEVGG